MEALFKLAQIIYRQIHEFEAGDSEKKDSVSFIKAQIDNTNLAMEYHIQNGEPVSITLSLHHLDIPWVLRLKQGGKFIEQVEVNPVDLKRIESTGLAIAQRVASAIRAL